MRDVFEKEWVYKGKRVKITSFSADGTELRLQDSEGKIYNNVSSADVNECCPHCLKEIC